MSSRRSASDASTAALIAAIRLPSAASRGVATANASPVEGESAGADLGELGEELSDLACLLRTRQVDEAVHLVVGDVRQQSLSGGACVERATGVGAGDESQTG